MKLTLKQKLIGASLSAVVVMAAVLTWLSADKLSQQTHRGVLDRAEAISVAASKGISDWVSIRKDITSAVNEYTGEQDLVPYLQQARNAGGFDDIFFGTPKGEMFRSHPERNRADYDPRVRPWYKDASAAGKQLITTAYQDAITNALLVTIAEPVRHNGQFAGVVGSDVLIDQLVNDVLAIDAGDNAFAMLIDTQNGTFLAHPDKKLLLKPVNSVSKAFNMNMIEKASGESRLVQVEQGGRDVLYYFSKVPNTPWIFAIQMDRDTEFAAENELLTGLLISALIVTIIVVLIVSWLVSFLFQDLGRVSRALAEIASGEGDLTQRLEPRSDDEVGQLATNFNVFVGNMHTMISKLSHVSQSLTAQSRMTAQHAE